jgi:hypothetical protein
MRKADNLTTILCRCHEIWEPKLPGTCNGTALPLRLIKFAFVGEKNFNITKMHG